MFQNTHPTPLQVKLRSKKCLRPGIHLAKKFNGGNNDYTVILRELNFSIEGLSVFKFKHTLIQKWRGFFIHLTMRIPFEAYSNAMHILSITS